LKRLLVLLLVLAVVYGGAEVGTKVYAESRIEQQIEASVPNADASSSVSLPVVYPVLVESDVARVRVSVRGIDVGPFDAEVVTANFTGVRIDRDATFRDRALRVRSIDRLVATAEITDSEVSKILPSGLSFEFQPDTVTLNLPGGISVGGRFEQSGGGVRFAPRDSELPGGLRAPSFRLADVPYLSCINRIEIQQGRAIVSCEIDNPPPPPELTSDTADGR
jgi:hypothetical protein